MSCFGTLFLSTWIVRSNEERVPVFIVNLTNLPFQLQKYPKNFRYSNVSFAKNHSKSKFQNPKKNSQIFAHPKVFTFHIKIGKILFFLRSEIRLHFTMFSSLLTIGTINHRNINEECKEVFYLGRKPKLPLPFDIFTLTDVLEVSSAQVVVSFFVFFKRFALLICVSLTFVSGPG